MSVAGLSKNLEIIIALINLGTQPNVTNLIDKFLNIKRSFILKSKKIKNVF